MAEETAVQDQEAQEGQEPEAQEPQDQDVEMQDAEAKEEEENSTEKSLLDKKEEAKKSLLDKQGEEKQQEDVKQEKAPENYEFQFPKGMEVDKSLLEKATPLFKELNLTNAKAQKLVDLIVENYSDQAKQYQTLTDGWREQTIKDLGPDWRGQIKIADKFMQRFGSEAAWQVLEDSNLRYHPEVVKMFIRAGKAISQDTFVSGGNKSQPTSEESKARKLFNKTQYS